MSIPSIFLLSILLTTPAMSMSLFDEATYRPFIADKKAYLPGDLLTVIVLETSNAKTSADLASSKEIKTALEASYNKRPQEVAFGLKGDGRTGAKTERFGKIKASITVRIVRQLPNNSFAVEGYQKIKINGELQTICLKGLVRQEDISTQNTILSTRIGDATISYAGDGSVSNSQRYNFIYRILSFAGLV